MTDVNSVPLQDNFQTSLSQSLAASASALTIKVNAVPDFTFPSGATLYVTIEPGKIKEETVKVESFSSADKTMTIASGGRAQDRWNVD